MKTYPSILGGWRNFQEFDAYVFDKLDGSNLRWEWSKKRGWYKFGTRHRLFDITDLTFGRAIPLFQETLSENISKIAKDARWESLVVFTEFYGPNSFAGSHQAGDDMTLSLIDAAPYKQGLLGPKEFLEIFGGLKTATYLGNYRWTKDFITRVSNSDIPGITFEGVVGKAGRRHELIMAKAKTRAWMEKVKATYEEKIAEQILAS